MTRKQLEALSDAEAAASGRGLVSIGQTWSGGHHNNTIQSLVDRGYLALYAKQTVAHITALGIISLEDFRNK